MARLPGDAEGPRAEAAAGDGCILALLLPHRVLELQCDVAPLGGFDQIAARNLERLARALLVAGERGRAWRALEQPRVVQRLEREEDDDVTSLHVCDARPLRDVSLTDELLERTVLLEDRIEVADEQQSLALRALVLGEQVPGPVRLWRFRPAGRKSERIELGPQDPTDLANSLLVQRPAVDVDELLQQRHRFRRVVAGVSHEARLLGRRPDRGALQQEQTGGARNTRWTSGDNRFLIFGVRPPNMAAIRAASRPREARRQRLQAWVTVGRGLSICRSASSGGRTPHEMERCSGSAA